MNANDPIRISDLRRPQTVAASVCRGEAERQFRFSLALVVVMTLATVAVAAGTRLTRTDVVHTPAPSITVITAS